MSRLRQPMGDLVYLLGGPRDGEVMAISGDSSFLVFDVTPDEGVLSYAPRRPVCRHYAHYHYQRVNTPDGWTQVVMASSELTYERLRELPESVIITAIMTVWREYHRRQASLNLVEA